MTKRIVFFGELFIWLTAPGREVLMQSLGFDVHAGGAEANVAVGLAHSGHDPAHCRHRRIAALNAGEQSDAFVLAGIAG